MNRHTLAAMMLRNAHCNRDRQAAAASIGSGSKRTFVARSDVRVADSGKEAVAAASHAAAAGNKNESKTNGKPTLHSTCLLTKGNG